MTFTWMMSDQLRDSVFEASLLRSWTRYQEGAGGATSSYVEFDDTLVLDQVRASALEPHPAELQDIGIRGHLACACRVLLDHKHGGYPWTRAP